MTTKIEYPKEILQKAVKLRNAVRTIYLELYRVGKPITADEIAKVVGHARAYVNMRLNQLEDMGLIKSTHDGKEKLYEVLLCES